MILPTRRAVIALGTAAFVGVAGYLNPAALDAMLLLDLVLVIAVVVDSRLAVDPAALDVERIAPSGFSVGRASVVTYRWHNPTPRPARLLVRERWPVILGATQPVRPVEVPAGETVSETLAVRPRSRGRETHGWMAIRSRGPFGLALRQSRRDAPWSALVFPNIPTNRLRASVAEASRRRDTGLKAVRRFGEGRVFESLREFVPGDDPRHIDWKATARRQKLMTRLFEEERRQHVMLVIDAGRLLTARVGGADRFEHVVNAALSIAFAAQGHNDDVGIMVFADTVQHYVAPHRGPRGLRQVLEILAGIQPTLVEPDYPGAFRYLAVRNRKRAMTVLFTDVIDAGASSALVASTRSLLPRHLPVAVTVRNPDLEAVATCRPDSADDAYRKAAADALLLARDEALASMRRSGVLVLDVPPENAGAAVVDAYTQIKRRGRL